MSNPGSVVAEMHSSYRRCYGSICVMVALALRFGSHLHYQLWGEEILESMAWFGDLGVEFITEIPCPRLVIRLIISLS